MRKKLLWILVAAVVVLAAVMLWQKRFSPTKVAFVNYQITTLGQIAKSNDNNYIKIKEIGVDELHKLRNFDMVMVNGMGLRLTEEQRTVLQEVADDVPTLTTAATNPANSIVTLDAADADTLVRYLNNGGRGNYRSMLNYIRLQIDGKRFRSHEPQPVKAASHDLLNHFDPKNPDDEDLGFNTIKDYDNFLKTNGLYDDNAPRIVLTGVMGEPNALIAALEKSGNVVYHVSNMRAFVSGGKADSVQPSAVINMAHGRMGDYMVEYLKRADIPLFTTVYVPQLTEDWEADKMGMSGGFLSQSIVTPEIDGAIRPYAIFSHRVNAEGLQEVYAEPNRLADFVQSVNNQIALKNKPNSEKKVAIYYYKGPGQNALAASGMEVVPSLFNLLQRLKKEGYRVENLPNTADELGQLIQRQGSVLGTYAEGAFEQFMQNGNPELMDRQQYDEWMKQAMRPELYEQVRALYGDFPGQFMATADGRLAVARLQFGNVVLMPQPMAGLGDNDFKIVHGTDAAPPYTYIAAYLWARYGFQADAIMHFGTHGSLEYTPRKQAALCANDWPDRLIGTTPHLYLYTIGNVGEAMIAKRRSYAILQSYLTPAFKESGTRNQYRELSEAVKAYFHTLEVGQNADKNALEVKRLAVKLGIHRSLELDSLMTHPYSEDDIVRIDNFAEELSTEKITGRPYILGVPYDEKNIESSVFAMATDPIAYSLLALDKQRGKAVADAEKNKSQFTTRYLEPARQTVAALLANPDLGNDAFVCRLAGITQAELDHAREVMADEAPIDMMSMMMQMAQEMPDMAARTDTTSSPHEKPSGMTKMMRKMGKGMSPDKAMRMAKMMGADDEALAKMEAAMGKQDTHTEPVAVDTHIEDSIETVHKQEVRFAEAIMEVERTVNNVSRYRDLLKQSPEMELSAIINALNGGYTEPSPGGDPIVNPNVLPTGRNLYGINAESTPSESAWEKGKLLADNTIAMYRQRHNDSLPRKVSYTLWSGEFIETEGATIAQVLYMLGVEPLRDAFGRVTDLRLMTTEELGRPRIDVVVQTSGQLRDLAASRLFLINRAVEMAANANDGDFGNFVAEGVKESERTLMDKGMSPKEAREVSRFRVFGGVNGGYGTGIQGMVQAGDRWEKEQEIAEAYLNNMGAFYGDEAHWESVRQSAFEAALNHTDAVVQPRQSNTWGALSLDHVYEFMGGMNLAVRNVTGKDPDAYLSDYRNRNHVRMQEVKEAIGVESRATLFNPNYISEMMQGEASAAATFAELVQNTYGWNVMKPQAIDNEMWDEIYEVYVKDKHQLGTRQYFENQNPAALQEMTAVMMETARKGMWQATEQQLADIAQLHTELVNQHKPSCSGFVCDNAKLRDFIASKTDPNTAKEYNRNINRIRETSASADQKGMVMKREQLSDEAKTTRKVLSDVAVGVGLVAALMLLVVMVRRRRKQGEES